MKSVGAETMSMTSSLYKDEKQEQTMVADLRVLVFSPHSVEMR